MTRPLTYLRNLAIATLAILVVLILATQPLPELVLAQALVQFADAELEAAASPGETVTLTTVLILASTSEEAERTFSIDVFDLPNDFEIVIPNPTVTIPRGDQATITVLLTIPDDEIQRIVRGRLRARDLDDSAVEANAQLIVNITESTTTLYLPWVE